MKSCLKLETEVSFGKTNIKDLYFEAPYKIMSPFQQGKHTTVMQMCASAGMLSGDEFTLDITAGKGSDLSYTSQSYEKIFASKGQPTKKKTKIRVDSQAKLNYMPRPMIPFAQSDFHAENEIHLAKDSRFLYCDIFNCGRVAMGERFCMKCYQSKTRVYVGDCLVFADHTLLAPDRFTYDCLGMWGTYTHNGLLYIYTGNVQTEEELLEKIRKMVPGDMEVGCTRNRAGITLRALGRSGEELYEYFTKIAAAVQ